MYAIQRTQIGRLVAARSVLAAAACRDSSYGPVRGDSAGHSFAAVIFEEHVVARVRITSGQGILGLKDLTDGGNADVVVMDDVLHDEPFKP